MKKHILSITFIILSITSFAQNKANDTPLFLFLQKNADSTIAIEYVSNWIQKPSLQIISKKEDTVSIYTYADKRKFEESGNMPKKIRKKYYLKVIKPNQEKKRRKQNPNKLNCKLSVNEKIK